GKTLSYVLPDDVDEIVQYLGGGWHSGDGYSRPVLWLFHNSPPQSSPAGSSIFRLNKARIGPPSRFDTIRYIWCAKQVQGSGVLVWYRVRYNRTCSSLSHVLVDTVSCTGKHRKQCLTEQLQ